MLRAALLVSLAAGCHASPRTAMVAPASASRPARCTLVLVADAKDAVGRLGGGAFVLRREGSLARYARDGRFTGSVETELEAVAPAGPYVCGLGPAGVACFRDRHEDLTCPSAPFEPDLQPLDVPPAGELAGELDRPVLRLGDDAYEVTGTCEQHCISLGCDGPRRCIDPCPAGVRPALAARRVEGGGHFLSNERTREVTHSSK
jgi:hypothetical protein